MSHAAANVYDFPNPNNPTRRERKEAERRRKAAKADTNRTIPLKARTSAQHAYLSALGTRDQVFAIGPAGTGKTYLAARHVAQRFKAGEIDTMKFARPQVSRERHKSGFLPGNLNAKLAPWFAPIMAALREEFSGVQIDKLKQEGKLEFLSFEHLRGVTLKDCAVVLDEAQNCDFLDLKLFLTRIGENAQLIVCGDETQADIPDSALSRVVDMAMRYKIDIAICTFSEDDVVRSHIAAQWVKVFAADARSFAQKG